MADNREVILRVSTDAEGARKSLEQLTAELRSAEQQARAARVGSEEYAKALTRVGELRVTIREVGRELKGAGSEGINALKGIDENAKFAENSLGELLQIQKQLSKEALNLKPGTAEFEKFAKVSAAVNARVREVKEQLSGVPPLTKQLGGIRGLFVGIDNGIKGVVNGLSAIGPAIAATGLGALIQIATQVINALSGFNVIADIFERIAAVGQAAFGQLIIAFQKIAEGDFRGAIEALTGGLIKAGIEADQLTVSYQNLDDKLRGLTLTESQLNKEIDLALARARDRTKSDKERLAALDEAEKKEKALLELQRSIAREELTLASQRVEISQQEIKLADGTVQQIIKVDAARDEYIDKYIAAQKKLDDTERASLVLQEKIAQRRNQIIEGTTKTVDEQAKQLDSLRKKYDELDAAISLQRGLDALTDESEKTLLRARSALDQAIKAVEQQVGATEASIIRRGQKITEAEAEALAVIAKLREQFGLVQASVEAQREAAELERERKKQEKLAAIRREANDIQLRDAQRAQDDFQRLTSEAGRNATFQERRELVRRLRQFERNQEQVDEALRLSAEQRTAIIRAEKRVQVDEEVAAGKIVLGTAQTLNQSLSTLAGDNAAAQAAFAGFSKQIALFQSAIAAGEAISKATAASAGVPFPGNLAAIATAVAAVTATIAQGVALFSGAEPPAPPRFAKGGILRGPSHSRGGILLHSKGRPIAEAEGGEVVLTKAVSSNPTLLAQASAINVAAGGRPLSSGARVRFAALGGVTPTADPFDTMRSARQALTEVRAEIAVSEITKAQRRVTVKEQRSKIT